MKNAKKLALLLLSLVLLVGVFTVATLAEDSANAATVLYPDGTTEEVAVGSAIVPKAFTDGLYAGAGNTLYQDDATEGWTFTVSGETAALTNLTVTEAMAGKTIVASGADKVYAVIDITIPEGDYYEYISGGSGNSVYVLSGTEETTKRVAGEYKVYLYDEASLQKFFSKNVSLEIGGVTVDYQDLRAGSKTFIKTKLYADFTIANTFNWGGGYNRATDKDTSGGVAEGSGGNAQVYFDFNGHSVVIDDANTMEVTEMTLILYSTQPGAHLFREKAPTAFYVSDGCALYVGNNDSNTDTYSDNLSIHAKALFNQMYGSGAYIIGGHYYQTAGATTPFFDFARRVNAIQNASFYVQSGNAVLDDDPTDGGAFSKGTSAITNCSFYSFGSSPLTNLAKGATPAFSGCSFYNITFPNAELSGLADATSVALTPKTVTFADGTTAQYFAETLDEAKAFVETHPKAKAPAPYGKWIDGEYMLSLNPVAEVAYDASFNATVTITDTAFAKIYFTSEEVQANGFTTMVYHTTDDFASYFTSANVGDTGNGVHTGALSYSEMCENGTMSKITLTVYENVKCDSFTFNNSKKAYQFRVNVDLNGYTLDLGTTGAQMNGLNLWIYSSRPGAHFYSSSAPAFTVNDVCILNLGAADENGTYARNINFHCKDLLGNTYGSGANIYGGNYYQLPGSSATGFVSIARRVTKLNNASFFVLPGYSVFYDGAYTANFYGASTGANPMTGNSFYAMGENVSLLNSIANATPKFESCSFYGVAAENIGTTGSVDVTAATNTMDSALPTMRTITWADGTTEKFFATSLEQAKAFVESLPKAKAPAPYAVTKDGALYVALTPSVSIAYDDNFNATVSYVDGELSLVYYTVEETLTGKINYVISPNLGDYLVVATHGGAKITLHQDMTIAPVTPNAERVPVDATSKTQAEGAVYKLDLNGHKLTFSGSGLALDIKLSNFYVYSSVAGGVIDASNHTLFRGNNDDYKWKDGRVYVNDGSDAWKAYTGTTNIKPSARVFFGEDSNTTTANYGANLTVYCQKINQDMYGTSGSILGGTYIQSASSAATYFMLLGREGSNNSHMQHTYNATFVLTNPATAPLYLRASDPKLFTNCTFISSNSAGAPLTAFTDLATVGKTFTFTDCNFYNVLPYASSYVVYNNAAFGASVGFSTEDFDAGDSELYLVHSASAKTVTAGGVEYVLDGALVSDLSTVLKLTRENIGLEYWAVGSVPPAEAENVIKVVDSTIYKDAYYDYSGVAEIDAETGAVIAAGEASVAVAYRTVLDVAFTYQVAGGEVQYVETLGSPEADGQNFVNLLNNLYNIKIVMYSDIVLPSGVQFATLKDYTDVKGTVVQIVDQSGYVDWDLNGCAVTVAADATPIKMVAERENQGAQTNNVLHYASNASFKLYSSVAGGQYINLSSYPIFGVNKYSSPNVIGSYLLGTNDPAVNGGDNLTIVSNAAITLAYETQSNGPEGYTVYINGGTYVYNGSLMAFCLAGTAKINNAKILTTGTAAAVFVNHYWAPTNLTVENCEIIAKSASTTLINQGHGTGVNTTVGKAHTVSVKDVSFAGGTVLATYPSCAAGFSFAGDFKLASTDALAVAYPTAPDGKAPAYSSITVYGETAKVLGYCETSSIITVQNNIVDVTEAWFPGATYVGGEGASIQKVDGVWYYYTNPEWFATIDGAAVEDILAAENAGKTVVVGLGGEKELLYFSRDVGGIVTYYYGDATAAGASLKSIFGAMGSTSSTIILYSNLTISNGNAVVDVNNGGGVHFVDLNGYKLTFANPDASYAFKAKTGDIYFYSSVSGGVIDASAAKSFWMTDGSGEIFLGEPNGTSTAYGKNFTVICKAMNTGRLWSTNGYIYGGTYMQVEGLSAVRFFGLDANGALGTVRNATFMVESLSESFIRCAKGTYTNCIFIAKNATALMAPADASAGGSDGTASFIDCYFYNVIPTVIAGATINYTNCYFDSSVAGALGAGFVAKTDAPVLKNVNGVDYTFDAIYTTSAALVDWGFGLGSEYWVAGAVATHEDITLDGMFIYSFKPVTVGAEDVTAEIEAMKGIVSGKALLSIAAESEIRFILTISVDTTINVVKIGDETFNLADAEIVDGYYVISYVASPSKAADTLVITARGTYDHEIALGLEDYASAVLGDASLAAAHNLVYAMVEYVELMSGKDVAVDAPAGYEKVSVVPKASENAQGILYLFAICHDEQITFAVTGEVNTKVTLTLGNGTQMEKTIGDEGAATFTVTQVFALSEAFTLETENETYTYSLENYIYALENAESGAADASVIAKLEALYNYVSYAAAYVK